MVVEFLHTAPANLAVVTVFVHVDLAVLAEHQQVLVFHSFGVVAGEEPGVDRVAQQESAVLNDYDQHEDVEEDEENGKDGVGYLEHVVEEVGVEADYYEEEDHSKHLQPGKGVA